MQRTNTNRSEAVAMNSCERCHEEVAAFTTSYFNTDTICMACCERERAHPEFDRAQQIEIEACRRGDYNFPGIGVPAELLGLEPPPC